MSSKSARATEDVPQRRIRANPYEKAKLLEKSFLIHCNATTMKAPKKKAQPKSLPSMRYRQLTGSADGKGPKSRGFRAFSSVIKRRSPQLPHEAHCPRRPYSIGTVGFLGTLQPKISFVRSFQR